MKKLLLSLILTTTLSIGFTQCGCTKLVFIVDNSGSVSTTEFNDMKKSIDTISAQLLRQYPGSEITVLQYASQNATNHTYAITVPFTSNQTTAQTWSRAFATGGTVNSTFFQDHLPGSLERMRRDSIWYAGKGADIITGGCNTRVFVFADAAYGGAGCCSHLINNGQATMALPNYGEYNLHKSTFSSEWTFYHVTFGTNTTAQQAGAAIASKGGSYIGTRALNPGDPQGAGGPRKYYSFTTFNLTQQNVDTALSNINAGAFTAQFPNDTICLGDSASFSSNVTFPTSYVSWDFGDGNSDTSLTPSHLYAVAGTYQVTFIVWSDDSTCKDTIVQPVVVNPTLVADFIADTVCLSNPTTFTNTTTGFISSLNWNFGDGTGSTFIPDTTHVYALPGTVPVTLIVKSSSVCADTITKSVVIYDKPNTQFSLSNQCQFVIGSPLNSTTTTIPSTMGTISWGWDFGDGGTSALQNPSYAYNTPGSYNIELIATTDKFCADTFSLPIVINPKPIASYDAGIACLTQVSTFNDLSTVSSGAITNWAWNIPGSPVVPSPVYTFPTGGAFPITLTVTTDSACTDDTTINITVRPLPIPDFNFSPLEIFVFDTKVCFANNTTGAIGYFWDFDFFGPDGTSILQSPCTVTFPDDSERKYNVKLTAINQYGCRDSIYKEVSILDGFILYAPNTFSPNGDDINELFKVFTEGIVDYEIFIFDRWGEKIFHSTDPSDSWDGTYNGVMSKTDAYVYRIIVKSKNNVSKEYIGQIKITK